jgi:hypothetical protein
LLNNCVAESAVNQPCTGMRDSGSSLIGKSNCAPDQEFFYHIPTIRCAFGIVNDERGSSALTWRLLQTYKSSGRNKSMRRPSNKFRITSMKARVID